MSNQPESSDFKNDFNSAILERKKSPNRFVVDEAIDDDNSSFSLHHSTMEKAAAFPGDAILIKAKKRKDIVFILFADESCEDPKIRMNKIVRSNLRVRLGDVILSSLLTNALTSSTESVCTRLHGYVGLVPSHVPGSARGRVRHGYSSKRPQYVSSNAGTAKTYMGTDL
ncbi:PREDICTED: cell division control protein 48 homolog E-like [Brassica oleracea var. oleracea]|uniref:cell division control protein 48 homolog E-like n=1 Tax=Brassica oleracea var. oleracea TaxID=109376 RepID=UPI0006A6DADC|nr:PREDICTED: cell division control protein 48 homolog E-like [Brassica oleracea var. oleracea]